MKSASLRVGSESLGNVLCEIRESGVAGHWLKVKNATEVLLDEALLQNVPGHPAIKDNMKVRETALSELEHAEKTEIRIVPE
jgi:hypothetical protein